MTKQNSFERECKCIHKKRAVTKVTALPTIIKVLFT